MFDDLMANKNTAAKPADSIGLSAGWFDTDDSYKPALPVGEYTVKISDYGLHRSKNNPLSVSFKWTLSVVEGEYTGKDIVHYTWLGRQTEDGRFEDASQGRSFRLFLKTIGVTPQTRPDLLVNGEFRLTDEAVVNNTLKVHVAHEKTLRNDSAGKPKHELTDADYLVNLKVDRVYPVEPAGKKFAPAGQI